MSKLAVFCPGEPKQAAGVTGVKRGCARRAGPGDRLGYRRNMATAGCATSVTKPASRNSLLFDVGASKGPEGLVYHGDHEECKG